MRPRHSGKDYLTPSVLDELLRLLHNEYGYTPPSRASQVESRLEPFAPYVLLSEFAFGLGEPLPDALASIPIAPVQQGPHPGAVRPYAA